MRYTTTFRHALEGLRYSFLHERNFRIHTVFAAVALVLAWALHISATQWLFIITAIASVIALEIVNTVFERVVDMFQPRVHHYAGIVKDLMAAAVLVAALSAILVGALIFIPLLITRLS